MNAEAVKIGSRKVDIDMTRGYRNNNPLNIRIGAGKKWKGEIRPSQDAAFAQFESMEYGYRAAFKLLDNYRKNHGCVQLADFINRWAPPSENNTSAYIQTVCKRTRLADVSTIDTRNGYQMKRIVAAMSFVENGIEPDMDQIDGGWALFTL